MLERLSLALDFPTDHTDITQLWVWVKLLIGDTFPERMLALLMLTGQTWESHFFPQTRHLKTRFLWQLASCSVRNRKGERINCSAQKLCSKLRAGELRMTMDTVTWRDSFILAQALKRRRFRTRRSGSQVTECSLITSWTCYHLRDHLWRRRVDVKTTRSCRRAFLCDITHHLNSLNLQLQEKQKLPSW